MTPSLPLKCVLLLRGHYEEKGRDLRFSIDDLRFTIGWGEKVEVGRERAGDWELEGLK